MTCRVRHAGREALFDLSWAEAGQLRWASSSQTRPKTLTCTKTQASYDALARQREADITALAALSTP